MSHTYTIEEVNAILGLACERERRVIDYDRLKEERDRLAAENAELRKRLEQATLLLKEGESLVRDLCRPECDS